MSLQASQEISLATVYTPRALSLRDAAIAVADASPTPPEAPLRWMLVDAFESYGSRYVIAQLAPNAGRADSDKGLRFSSRDLLLIAKRAQGQPVKTIAADAGLATSTVSTILGRASKALDRTPVGRLMLAQLGKGSRE